MRAGDEVLVVDGGDSLLRTGSLVLISAGMWVKSVREGGRVRQVTLDYLGAEKSDTCELIRLKKSYG
ncbi:MAG: hypothetical protein U9Q22_05970 [Candidatus Altiarchaeota archaeon]|nr:hypothetical protein [Candidatus Altiarchaeota archaeon]